MKNKKELKNKIECICSMMHLVENEEALQIKLILDEGDEFEFNLREFCEDVLDYIE